MTTTLYQVTRDVFCVQGTAVNWILVREGRDLTLIDAGYPGDTDALEASVRSLGHRVEDIRAVLVTHAHVDHIGALGRLHERYGIAALMHPDELPNALGQTHESATPADVARRAWRPSVLRWSLAITRAGATGHPVVPHARAYPDSGALDLPGRPQPLHVAGHTSGSSVYVLDSAGVVVTGDALVTGHPISAITGPQLLPDFFTLDPGRADAALDVLAGVEADVLVPGHGTPWRGEMATAVEHARRTAPRRLR
ncbi:MAG: MBL fold metallo-hydrolase [Aeromicrobium sp.]|uniref:MBL fold metallo-hydrolase n=1 Tax=Aeromicrobium sp. TaxID=1871063 RepID=UPI0039E6347B